ncbi:MAG: geranylgeranylglyceryl/heptaprenylglyceryl phosphate synthase [candidate division KSB1 bacterium]|nr:geranylgeranylglyceryl/heptaprenylglyceryl phosphate synthase [candidate division KSB1 bacterium]MDZ7302806.1 geranylgeranylglyceryl/heptaprenylglyceryl phosphate synthase [candidate division KSB1 bacterium]MDZ7311823.1 geranylgeranylglyceryl/heptaprenylglyceryl phosphate synthase [candidate division KSB1 bacterium]
MKTAEGPSTSQPLITTSQEVQSAAKATTAQQAHNGRTTSMKSRGKILNYLLQTRTKHGAGYFVLIDPDKWQLKQLPDIAAAASENGADAILIGGSLLLSASFDDIVKTIKKAVTIPCVIFPGSTIQLSRHADAILFLSLISSRNADYLIGMQIMAAPIIRLLGLEPLPTGYMLIASGRVTSAEFMSNSRPIPRDKNDIAQATALAAEYLGMQMVYLEAGSGADLAVTPEMVKAVSSYVSIPVIVGGGIRTPEEAEKRVKAGASFVVTGNVLEKNSNVQLIREFAHAIHGAVAPSSKEPT